MESPSGTSRWRPDEASCDAAQDCEEEGQAWDKPREEKGGNGSEGKEAAGRKDCASKFAGTQDCQTEDTGLGSPSGDHSCRS